jgi:hypothetical protein
MPKKERREFRMNLMNILIGDGVIIELDTTSPLNIHGFNLDKKVFVHEDTVGIAEFSQIKQDVVSHGMVGREFVLDNYGFTAIDFNGDVEGGHGPR